MTTPLKAVFSSMAVRVTITPHSLHNRQPLTSAVATTPLTGLTLRKIKIYASPPVLAVITLFLDKTPNTPKSEPVLVMTT